MWRADGIRNKQTARRHPETGASLTDIAGDRLAL